MAAALAGILSTNPIAFAQDESETNTGQEIKQKNVGSGESTNFNCGENSIEGGFIDAQLCGTVGADGGDGGGDGDIRRVTICHNTGSETNPTNTITVSVNALPAHLAHGDTVGACAGD